jgi:hypothetical protein
MGSNRFWHIVSVVKERLYASLSCRVANNNLIRVTDPQYLSTRVHLAKSLFHTSPQPSPHLPRTPPLTTPTIDTFPHFSKFFSPNFPAPNSLHVTFSKIPLPKNLPHPNSPGPPLRHRINQFYSIFNFSFNFPHHYNGARNLNLAFSKLQSNYREIQ